MDWATMTKYNGLPCVAMGDHGSASPMGDHG